MSEPASMDHVTLPEVSLIIPLFNEEECVVSTIAEAVSVLEDVGLEFEIVAVNDGSRDGTADLLAQLVRKHARLRVFSLEPNSGQSAAFGVGMQKARGRVIVLMDGDGQNDPRDIAALLNALEGFDAVCGFRAHRKDTWRKRVGSRLANAVRDGILHDGVIDTGCSLKAIRSDFARDLPMTLKGMHRFLPALLQMRGARIKQVPVNHRPRHAGKSKYTNFGRLMVTIGDLRAVRWMQKRHRQFEMRELK